jgi:hypothetical protein
MLEVLGYVNKGTKFEINSSTILENFPNSVLAKLIKSSAKSEIFLDHNPQAFSCILDYIRYGGGSSLLIPSSVCKEVVVLQAKEFGLGELKVDSKDPPPYEDLGHSSKFSIFQIQKLTSLVDNTIYGKGMEHISKGHRYLDIYFTDDVVKKDNIATSIDQNMPSAWICLNSEAPKEDNLPQNIMDCINDLDCLSYDQKEKVLKALSRAWGPQKNSKEKNGTSETTGIDIQFLLQPECLTTLKNMVKNKFTAKHVNIERKDLTVRYENIWGLLESKVHIAIKVSIVFA